MKMRMRLGLCTGGLSIPALCQDSIPRIQKRNGHPRFVRDITHSVMEAFPWSLLHPDATIGNFKKYAPRMSDPTLRGHFDVMVAYLFDEGARPHGLEYMDHGKTGSTVDTLAKFRT